MKPAVTQPHRRGARPGFPMRHKLAQLPFEAMEPMGMEVTGVVRHGLSRGSGEHRGRANQSSDIDGQTERAKAWATLEPIPRERQRGLLSVRSIS